MLLETICKIQLITGRFIGVRMNEWMNVYDTIVVRSVFEVLRKSVLNRVQNMKQWNRQNIEWIHTWIWKEKHFTLDRITSNHCQIDKSIFHHPGIAILSISFCHQNELLENKRALRVQTRVHSMGVSKLFSVQCSEL